MWTTVRTLYGVPHRTNGGCRLVENPINRDHCPPFTCLFLSSRLHLNLFSKKQTNHKPSSISQCSSSRPLSSLPWPLLASLPSRLTLSTPVAALTLAPAMVVYVSFPLSCSNVFCPMERIANESHSARSSAPLVALAVVRATPSAPATKL